MRVRVRTIPPFIQRPGSRPVGAAGRNKLSVFVHAGIGRGCSDWGLLEDEELRNSCGGFSDSVAPLRAEDGCLETLPDVQREVKHSLLPKYDRSLSSAGSQCDLL